MSDIGKLTTFSRLLQEEPAVMIPQVQRDYAYGREEKKVRAILSAMLDKMLEAVEKDHTEVFDFVYGGAYVKKEEVSDGLIPLDGQQRLTTMFLLYLYASIIQSDVDENSDAFKNLKKFRYETRQSATNFCAALVDKIRNDLRKDDVYSDRKKIKEHIKDHPSYIPSYDSDPTIASMLNVLAVIEEKCNEHEIEDLWTKLVERDNIQFYCLSLDRFGLADDLYIKMNSRGKKLTEFEIFKSDLEKKVKDIAPDLKDELSRLLDNDWMDLLWDYANCDYEDDKRDEVTKADGGYMHLFNNIFRIELFRREIEKKTNRKATIEEIITGEDDVKVIMSVFKVLSDIYKQEGIVAHWKKYFYFSGKAVGRDDKIRLFWQQKQNQKPVFHLAMERDLTVPEIVYFYTLVKVKLETIDEKTTQKILRVVRNLITANTRDSSARYEDLRGFMTDVNNIIKSRGIVRGKSGNEKFLSTSWEEENQKATALSGVYDELLKYENHEILQGSLMLFIKQYDISDLCNNLRHFEEIFDNDYKDRFDKFRIALINKTMTNGDGYLQYDASMENDADKTRRMFIHNLNDLSPFLIKKENRRNQDKILVEIAAITDVNSLKEPGEKCEEFDITSWQYYYVKYAKRGANIESTTHGYYAWDDKENKPLEMVILNSSYHSENNIEWKMLNHILKTVLDEGDKGDKRDNGANSKYKLDAHGSSPLELLQSGITITISQEGWIVQCNDMSIIQPLYQSTKYKITKPGEDNMYLLELNNNEDVKDYIDLAKDFIADIEAQPQPKVY